MSALDDVSADIKRMIGTATHRAEHFAGPGPAASARFIASSDSRSRIAKTGERLNSLNCRYENMEIAES